LSTLRTKRIAATVGVVTQFGLMPLIAFFYANVFKFNNEHGIGIMLVASAPGGVTSSLITYWSGGDVALSVTMSSVSTILAFAMMPFLIFIYIERTFTDEKLDIPYEWIFISLMLLIGPCAIGYCVRARSEVWATRMIKFGSIMGVIFLVFALVYGITENSHLFNQSFGVWFSSCTLQLIGSAFAFVIARLFRLPIRAQKTISIEAGIQNSTLVITMITNSFSDVDERLKVLVPVYIYSVAYFWNSLITLAIFRFIGDPDSDISPNDGNSIASEAQSNAQSLEIKGDMRPSQVSSVRNGATMGSHRASGTQSQRASSAMALQKPSTIEEVAVV